MKPKQSESEKAAISLQQQELALSQKQQAQAGQDAETRNRLMSEIQPSLDYYGGRPEESPYYKALNTEGIEGTSGAYQSAQAATRRRALNSGYADSGIELGAQTGLSNEQAKAEAAIPRESLMTAIGPNMQATQMKASIAGGFDPLRGLQASGSTLNSSMNPLDLQSQLEKERQKRTGGLFGTLAKIGTVGASFIPGVGPYVSKAIGRYGSLS